MKTSDSTKEIASALAKAQAQMKPALEKSDNPAFRSKYADLTAIWNAARGPLTANGISVVQEAATNEDGVGVTTRLFHSSGEWIEVGPLVVPVAKHDAHGTGSATTYGKRYGLSAAIGIVADDDDDGNAATAAAPKAKPVKVKPSAEAMDEARQNLRDAALNGTDALRREWMKLNDALREALSPELSGIKQAAAAADQPQAA